MPLRVNLLAVGYWLFPIVILIDIAPADEPQQADQNALKHVRLLTEELSTDTDRSTGWIQTRTIPAAEAFQAAAGDEKYVYAISSKVIGKYERATGERVAISQGDAEHLNSGFFWEGRLLCAHSNYPSKPELSQIKALDVQTMQLSSFKDFGDFSGSLTWVVRHNNYWWCNFAFYGAENYRTAVVQFDNQWQEQDRWTLPMALIRELGQFSLSGGLWRGNDLLVTGHDKSILYCLRCPKPGSELQFVGQEKVPFTGQGIAYDPVTGGLIGINRSKRQVIFAVK